MAQAHLEPSPFEDEFSVAASPTVLAPQTQSVATAARAVAVDLNQNPYAAAPPTVGSAGVPLHASPAAAAAAGSSAPSAQSLAMFEASMAPPQGRSAPVPAAAPIHDLFGEAAPAPAPAPAPDETKNGLSAAAPGPSATTKKKKVVPKEPKVVAPEAKAAEPEAKKGPSAYSIWEMKHAQYLAEKQRKADEAKRVVATQARDDITKFYAMRQERVAQAKLQNRSDEKATKGEIANLFQYGAQWEKVGKMVNLAPKANDKRPIDRMRKLLFTLKNDAPGAGAGASAGPSAPASGAAAASASPASGKPQGVKSNDYKNEKNV